MLAALAIVILKVITTVVIAGASAIWAANYILSQAKLFIGMAVAPVMVPWLIMPYTTFLFDGWLKFMIGAGMMQVVGAIMIKITNILVTTMTSIAAGSTATNVILYVVLVVLAFIISYLMAEINGIAMGLLQGGSRVGFGFSSLSNLKNYGPHKGMGYAGGKAAALAGRGARNAGAAVGNAARRGVAAGYNRVRPGGESRGQLQALAPRVGELARRVEVCVRRWLKRATAAISRSRDGTGRWPRCTTVQ
ncbi:type IV secretion system protein (plasmid) [Ralstonia insidiosa]|nr:type IV secretion system protein [Ralstonia insidiosa]